MSELSRRFILDWLKGLGITIDKIENIGKGDAICALLTTLDPKFPKYKKNPVNSNDYYNNLKLAQTYFVKNGVKNYFPIDKMICLKMQDNLEVIQWIYKYWKKESALQAQVGRISDLSLNESNSKEKESCKLHDVVPETQSDSLKNPMKSHVISSGEQSQITESNLENSSQFGISIDLASSDTKIQGINGQEVEIESPEKRIESMALQIKALERTESEQNDKIETLKRYVKISYNETKFYFDKLEKIESILAAKDVELTAEVKQRILDILYEDN